MDLAAPPVYGAMVGRRGDVVTLPALNGATDPAPDPVLPEVPELPLAGAVPLRLAGAAAAGLPATGTRVVAGLPVVAGRLVGTTTEVTGLEVGTTGEVTGLEVGTTGEVTGLEVGTTGDENGLVVGVPKTTGVTTVVGKGIVVGGGSTIGVTTLAAGAPVVWAAARERVRARTAVVFILIAGVGENVNYQKDKKGLKSKKRVWFLQVRKDV